jgi:hypothetical protein
MNVAIKTLAAAAAISLALAPMASAVSCPGPDAFGHTCISPFPACQPVLAPNVVHTTGDDVCTLRDIGFTATHYGVPFTQVGVSTNGLLTIGACATNFTNDCPLPNAALPNGIIAPFWDDANLSLGGGTISDGTSGAAPFRIYAVQFTNVPQFANAANRATFQVQIHENGGCGELVVVYFDTIIESVGTWSPTVGIENASGTDGLQFNTCTIAPANGTCVAFSNSFVEGGAQCLDGLDNDCDGLIDCQEPDCAGANVETCDNGIDDDCDGLVDCEDSDCDTFFQCRLFDGIAALESKLDEQGLAITALEAKLDGIGDADCEIIRLLHTPNGQRESSFCGGYSWPAGVPGP